MSYLPAASSSVREALCIIDIGHHWAARVVCWMWLRISRLVKDPEHLCRKLLDIHNEKPITEEKFIVQGN
jgi:hypothetical protein